MNSKTKFGITIAALVFVALMLAISLVAVSVYGIKKINGISFAFKANKISGFIQADYSFAGKTTSMTTNGKENGNTILNYNGEKESSTKELQIQNNDSIVLSQTNDFVIFKYCFSNTNENDPFSLYASYQDSQKTDTNISVSWCSSFNQEIDVFPPQCQPVEHTEENEQEDTTLYSYDFFNDPISGLIIEPGTTYLYIKVQIINTTTSAEFSGDFTFQMIG